MAKGQKIAVLKKKSGYTAIAAVAAINIAGEVVASELAMTSIKKENFDLFLAKLHRIYRGEPVSIYLDNLNMHYNEEVVEKAHQYSFDLVYSPAYSSEWNPIERLWTYSKKGLRKKCLLTTDYSNEREIQALVTECINSVPSSFMHNNVLSCVRSMRDELAKLGYRPHSAKASSQ